MEYQGHGISWNIVEYHMTLQFIVYHQLWFWAGVASNFRHSFWEYHGVVSKSAGAHSFIFHHENSHDKMVQLPCSDNPSWRIHWSAASWTLVLPSVCSFMHWTSQMRVVQNCFITASVQTCSKSASLAWPQVMDTPQICCNTAFWCTNIAQSIAVMHISTHKPQGVPSPGPIRSMDQS